MNPIVYAIPVFFLLIGVEWLVARRRNVAAYRLGDAVSSLGLGAISQITGVLSQLAVIGLYTAIHDHARLTTLSADSPWVWLGALLGYDFLYYWHHRLGHEVAIFWAAHVVHHQSQCYNLSTALRQTSTGFIFGAVFYLPMALAGVSPHIFVAVVLVDLLYQFWIHTEQIGSLGWFDRWFASPSNHRVHHAVNDLYVDKNYGGILMLWDRLFGTYEPERPDQPAVFGTRSPLNSYDPLWANVEVYAALVHDARQARRVRDKFMTFFKPPGWRPADVAAARPKTPFDIDAIRTFAPATIANLKHYAGLQFALVMLLVWHFLSPFQETPGLQRLGYGAWLVLSVWSIAALLQGRAAGLIAEGLRLVAAGVMILGFGSWFDTSLSPLSSATATVMLGFSVVWLLSCAPGVRRLAPRA